MGEEWESYGRGIGRGERSVKEHGRDMEKLYKNTGSGVSVGGVRG